MSDQLPLFTEPHTDTPAQIYSPSADFDTAHPDFVQTTGDDRIIDPNLRRAQQVEHVGGGIGAALRGDLGAQAATVETGMVTEETTTLSAKDLVMQQVAAMRERPQEPSLFAGNPRPTRAQMELDALRNQG